MIKAIKFTAPETLPHWQSDPAKEYTLLVFDLKALHMKCRELEEAVVTPVMLTDGKDKEFDERLIGMPIMNVFPCYKGGTGWDVDVMEGRHRTAYLYHHGLEEIPALVYTRHVDQFMDMGLARLPTKKEEKAVLSGGIYPHKIDISISH